MDLLYVLSAAGNLLYEGQFGLHGRYQTYGQQSFIYDLLVAASRHSVRVSLAVDDPRVFPLTSPLARYATVHDFSAIRRPGGPPSAAIVDVVSDDVLDQLPDGVPVICIVHNAFTSFSDAFVRRCDHFVCMTETAFRHQGGQVPAHKLALVHQGVDLQRFRPAPRGPRADRSVPRVLVCSRLEGFKRPVVEAVIDSLAPREVDLTVVGDGAAFWPISDRWGARITLINHIPCHSIHNFIPGFDVVVSSGRGVMEALACGVPALCAGFGYAGPVHADNVGALLEANLTGAGMGADTSRLVHDVQRAMDVDPQVCREVAERHFCVDRFVSALLRLAAGRRTA